MVKTAILVSGGGANLQAILDANIFGELGDCELTAVISSVPDVYALTRAQNANIPSYVVDASIFPNRASFTEAIIKKLTDLDIEFIVLAGFKHYLEIQFFRAFPGKVMITYPSLVPAYYDGQINTQANSSFLACTAAIEGGCRITGATTLLVKDDPSAGLIVLQKPVEILSSDNAGTLQRRIMENAEWEILVKSIELYCSGKLTVLNRTVNIEE